METTTHHSSYRLASVMFLLLVALIYRVLLPGLEPMKTYTSKWFLLRKWFMDRLFLSPMFRYASERTLQTSSTFPWYLRLLGANVGAKAWMNVSIIVHSNFATPFLCISLFYCQTLKSTNLVSTPKASLYSHWR